MSGVDGQLRRIRYGMVGGGEGAFIGEVHRIAARIDGKYDLVAGAFSSDADKCRRSAAALGVAPDRAYGSYEEMANAEAAREDGIEAVSIVTPNHVHFPAAKAFIEAGIPVICDKPLTTTTEDAEALVRMVKESGRLFAVTYNYSGYPMVRQARSMVAEGRLGAIRVVQVEYPQDWLTEKLEDSGQKQASWRTDPARSGAGGCVGDIGTHAYHLAGFVTGLPAEELCADLTSFVDGRALDDNVHILLRMAGGARGMLWASQVAPGHENGLRLRVFGSKGGLEWFQEQPNTLRFTPYGEPSQLISRGGAGAGEAAGAVTRLPPGHPEGYLEGFANLYTEIAAGLMATRDGKPIPDMLVPTVEDGAKGVRFVDAAVSSNEKGGVWTPLR